MCGVYCGGDEVVASIGVGLMGYDTYKTSPGGCVNLSRSYLNTQSCPCVAPRVSSSNAMCKRWRLVSKSEADSGRRGMIKLLPSIPRQCHDSTLSTPLHVDEGSQCCQMDSHQNEWHVAPETTISRPFCAILFWLVVFDLGKIRSNDLGI